MECKIMRTFLAALAIFGCILIVGMIEDPCATEGLPAGCMENNQ